MTLLITDNSIVTTYPRYNVDCYKYDRDDIYNWLKQHCKYVGIGNGLGLNMRMVHRVYAKMTPEVEMMFIIKFEATKYDKKATLAVVKQMSNQIIFGLAKR